MGDQVVEGAQEVFGWHVGSFGGCLAVAAAMSTSEVTALCAFPEQLSQRVASVEVFALLSSDFESEAVADVNLMHRSGLSRWGFSRRRKGSRPPPFANLSKIIRSGKLLGIILGLKIPFADIC